MYAGPEVGFDHKKSLFPDPVIAYVVFWYQALSNGHKNLSGSAI